MSSMWPTRPAPVLKEVIGIKQAARESGRQGLTADELALDQQRAGADEHVGRLVDDH